MGVEVGSHSEPESSPWWVSPAWATRVSKLKDLVSWPLLLSGMWELLHPWPRFRCAGEGEPGGTHIQHWWAIRPSEMVARTAISARVDGSAVYGSAERTTASA